MNICRKERTIDIKPLAAIVLTALVLGSPATTADAATTIAGKTLTVDETWPPAGNPYLISGDIIIPPCRKLTIAAGTDIQLLLSDKDHTTIDIGFVAFVVSGQIVIAGSPTNPVVFEPGPGTSMFQRPWYGIYFRAGATGSRVQYAELMHPEIGLTFENASPTNAITRSRITGAATGIQSNDGTLVLDGIVVDGGFTGIETGRAHLMNCAFIGDGDGVGIYSIQLQTMRSLLMNVSVHNYAVGLYGDFGTVTMNNSIITCQTAISTSAWRTLSLANDDFYPPADDGITCSGCFSADPLYVADGDLHLQPGSPCIDRAAPMAAPDHDADGTKRPLGGGWDVGAYERAPSGDGGVGGPGLDMSEIDPDGGVMCVVPPDLQAPHLQDMGVADLAVRDLSYPVYLADLAELPADVAVPTTTPPPTTMHSDQGCSCAVAGRSDAFPPWPCPIAIVMIACARRRHRARIATLALASALIGGCTSEREMMTADAAVPSSDLAIPMVPETNDLNAPSVADLSMRPNDDLSLPPATSAPCLTGGSVLYVDEDSTSSFPGVHTFHPHYWDPIGTAPMPDVFAYQALGAGSLGVRIGFAPPAGQPLVVGQRYDNAVYPQTLSQTWMMVEGTGINCGNLQSTGSFQIESMTGTVNGTHTELTAIFEKRCTDGLGIMRGCIHFEQTFDDPDAGL